MKRLGRKPLVALLLLLLAGGGWYFKAAPDTTLSAGTTYTATLAPMEITVLEGGSVESLDSQLIKSEVQGQTKILTLIEEGYQITAEDVKNKLVLVELDSKELQDRLTERELDYQNAVATLTEAKEAFEIQRNQNESDLKAAELVVKFGRMDLERYMGEASTLEILKARGIDNPVLDFVSKTSAASEEEQPEVLPEEPEPERPAIDFSKYADPDRLGDGEARQKLRTLENSLVLAGEEVGLAQTQLEGTERLFEKEFVTKNDLDNDALKLRRQNIASESAETSKELFIRYEFPKEAEKLLSDYEESLRKLERAHRLAISKLAQAEAQLNSSQARYELQRRRRDEIKEQIEKCTIRAEREGLVVYGGSEDRWRDDDRIQEGATIRERQVIITIPDTSKMGVNVQVHESFVQRVKKGQVARIKVDSNPDIPLTGVVNKIGLLPDSQNRWMNPDLKVYTTEIAIGGLFDWLKPGMSAEVEIVVETLPSVIQVPMQAVQVREGQSVCYVAGALSTEKRVVETGAFNTSMVEIKSGLSAGEVVLLRPPAWDMPEEGEGDTQETTPVEEPAAPAGPPA
jgi:multidrug resistance efflux pump